MIEEKESVEQEKISLRNISGGDAIELFDEELEKVFKNVLDINTDWRKPRKVILTVTVKPNEGRTKPNISIDCNSKLASQEGVLTTAYIGLDGDNAVGYENNPKQLSFEDFAKELREAEEKPNMISFKNIKEALK